MKEDLKKSFEVLLTNGEYAEAEKLLVPYMQENPDDWDAKLLYGTCRMMQGDSETAKLIHQQAQGYFESANDVPEEQKSFWDKYKKLIFYGAIGTALVLGGVAKIKEAVLGMEVFSYVLKGEPGAAKYAGPEYYDKRPRIDPASETHLYAGPEYFEKQKNDISW